MTKPETLEEYYARHPFIKTVNLNYEEGHFNIFRIEEQRNDDLNAVSYGRKDYFKVCLVQGKSKIHYADKSFEVINYGLLFANPMIPYNWEPIDKEQKGYSFIFTESFLANYGDFKKYPFFQPSGYQVYELNDIEFNQLLEIFKQIKTEKESDFEFKDDVVKNAVFQLIHSALKIRPSVNISTEKTAAANRITSLFFDLLENQFPIRNTVKGVGLRTASDFADQMAVHVNHLNKSVKEVTQKTTSEIIAERVAKEAKIMLRHSSWAISEIAYSLGFEEPAHFSKFFKKHLKITPTQYRSF